MLSDNRIPHRRSAHHASGFSLIELLVVIAVISILAAIIFPVFASVREKGRQGTVMSNLHTISSALAAYKLDKGKYPDVLFGYAVAGASMDGAYTAARTAGTAHTNFPGIFPSYLPAKNRNDASIFRDPNNRVDDLSQVATSVPVNVLQPDGTLAASTHDFYKADAYDLSPMITGVNSIDPNTLVARYQSSWTNVDPALNVVAASGRNDYARQMRNPEAPGDTYVTCTTYHVPNSKVIVLWEDGHVHPVDTSAFLGTGPDVSSVAVVGPGTASPANFWKYSQNGF